MDQFLNPIFHYTSEEQVHIIFEIDLAIFRSLNAQYCSKFYAMIHMPQSRLTICMKFDFRRKIAFQV